MPTSTKKSPTSALASAIAQLQKAQALITQPPVSNGEIRKAQTLATSAIKALDPLIVFNVSGPDDEVNKKRGL
jgi:hypothetical protein